jgi:hypothetical protein
MQATGVEERELATFTPSAARSAMSLKTAPFRLHGPVGDGFI